MLLDGEAPLDGVALLDGGARGIGSARRQCQAPATTWQAPATGMTSRLRGLSAVSPQVAWASGANGTLLRTLNGGARWERVPQDRLPAALPGEGAFAASGTNVAVSGRDHVWIGTTASRVLRSSDRGRTWQVSTTPVASGPATGIFSAAFRDASHGVVVGGNYEREAEAANNAAFTSDGGATWTLVMTATPQESPLAYPA